MTLEMLLDGRSVVKVDLDIPTIVRVLNQRSKQHTDARSTPATSSQMRDLLSRIDPRSARFLIAVAGSRNGALTWREMRVIFGIANDDDWPAYAGVFGKGITRAYRNVLNDRTAKLVWWDDDSWNNDDQDDDVNMVCVDGPALEALRAAILA